MKLTKSPSKFTATLLCALVSFLAGMTSKASAEVHFTAGLDQTIPSGPHPIGEPPPPPLVLHAGAGFFTLSSNHLAFYLSLEDVEWQILIRKPWGQEIPIAICPMYELVSIPLPDPEVPQEAIVTVRLGCKPSGVLDLSESDITELLAGLWYVEARFVGPYIPSNLPSLVFGGYILPDDSDADGVPDFRDACGNTPAGAIINIEGCSIQQLSPCAGPWRNHAQYVKHVVRVTVSFLRAGLITPAAARTLMREAASSKCGRRRKRC